MQKDEELTQFLSDFFLSEDAPDLTDADVEMLMSIPDQSPLGMPERVRAKFTAKILEDLHPEQVQPLNKRWPLGRWIEATRKRARLTRGDIGTALGKDASFVEKLETGEILPWDLDTKEAIDIARLFRLAVKAMRQLVETSALIHQEYTDGITVAARSHHGWRSKERKDSMKLALDLYLARNSGQPALDEKILNWLGRLEEEFERR
jgi:transcriptional regulator with XRE-family HTH domain